MFKREKIHLLGSILSLIITILILVWLFLILKKVPKNVHTIMTVVTIPILSYTVVIGVKQYILKNNKQALFTVFASFTGISIFTSWTLYKESGINSKEVKNAILKWEEKNIEYYFKKYIKENKISEEGIKEIENSRELYNNGFIEKANMRTYIRDIILKEIDSNEMEPLYSEGEILQLIPK